MARKKVMIIDDSKSCSIISSALFNQNENFEIIATASNEEEALMKLSNIGPDLLIIEPKIIGINSKIFNRFKGKIVFFAEKLTTNIKLPINIPLVNKPSSMVHLNKSFGVGKIIIMLINKISGIREKINVLIVDDSVLMRGTVYKLLCTDKNINIIGMAGNGKEALDFLEGKNPDVILLDIEMPVMDGVEFLRYSRLKSSAKIIILSSIAYKGSPKAMEALSLGAAAIITKPSGSVSTDLAEKSGTLVLETIHKVVS
jgi:two-component system chemotaxis response regulator CheB